MTAPPLAVLRDTGRNRWANWHENFEQRLHKLYDVWNAEPNRSTLAGYNGTTRRLQQLLQEALDTGRSVRALGGGWSFTPVAATDGILLNTRPLNYRFPIAGDQVHPGFRGTGPLFFVQCGMSIAELNTYLASKNLALPTSGASNGQTIAGALSTGTHGAALTVGSIPEYVVALHVITGPGRSVWLERQSYPAVADALAGYVQADLVRDDELFDAAVVAFGSMGIIHGVVLEVTPLFRLNAWRKRVPLDDALWGRIERNDYAGNTLPGAGGRMPHHLQFVINPFDQGGGAFCTVMYREATCPAGSKPAEPFAKVAQGDGALELIGLLTDVAGDLTDDLAKLLTKLGYKEYDNRCGTPGQIFKDTTTRGHAASAAMGVPLDRAREATALAVRAVQQAKAPALVALRFVKASPATLAFTRYAPVTCVLEVDGPESARVRQAYRAAWNALDAAGIPYTFHWGKLNNLDRTSVRFANRYGSAVQHWMDARARLLPTPELRRLFANAFTDHLDLSD
ncbi:MAG TPA: FAD-binding protein [Gemmatimonadales bacterium]